MLPIKTYLMIGAVIAILGALGGTYAKGRHDGRVAEIAAQDRSAAAIREASAQMQQAAASEIAKIEVRNVTVRQKAETIVREVPVYRDCQHTPDGLRAVNEALTGRPQPTGDSKLPGTNPGDGSVVRGNHPETDRGGGPVP